MMRKTAVLVASSALAVSLFYAAPAEAAAVTCAVGGGNTPTGWSVLGVGGGVAASAAPFVSPTRSATDCYIMTDTSSADGGNPWPGSTPSGFDITTVPGIPNIPADPVSGQSGTTNGSAMISPVFTANAGQVLKFDFAFISNDGTQTFSDWAAAFLLPVDGTGAPTGASSLNLFTARTSDNSQVVPGYGFAAFPSGLTLTPPTAFLQGDTFCLDGLTGGTACDGVATQFGPIRYPFSLGSPGDPGGSTPWIGATFNFDGSTAGMYELIMAVGNVGDQVYSTGLLFAGSSITGGSPAEDPEDLPEPGSLPMLAVGLVALGFISVRRKAA